MTPDPKHAAEALERLRPRGEMAVVAGDDCDDVQPAHAHRCVVCDADRDEGAEALCAACAGATAAALMHAPGCVCPCCKTYQSAKSFVGSVQALPEVREADAFNGAPVT